jgi:ribosomal-protein-alanine N-acetyltransferase
MIQFELLETTRLTLKKIDPKVFQQLFQESDKTEIMQVLGLHTEEEFAKEKMRFDLGSTMFNKSFVNFFIQKKGENQVIGSCGFHTWYTNHHRAEIGYAMTSDQFKRQGIMTEAMRRILRFGFEEMHLNRVEAFVGPTNVASIRLLKKMGFSEEGMLRQHYYKNGKSEDSVIYGLLNHEFLR